MSTFLIMFGLMADLAGLGIPIRIWPPAKATPIIVQPTAIASTPPTEVGVDVKPDSENASGQQPVDTMKSTGAKITLFLPGNIPHLTTRASFSFSYFINTEFETVRKDFRTGNTEMIALPYGASNLVLELFPLASRSPFMPEPVTISRQIRARFLMPQNWSGDLVITHENLGTVARTGFGPKLPAPVIPLLSGTYHYILLFYDITWNHKLSIRIEGKTSVPDLYEDFQLDFTEIRLKLDKSVEVQKDEKQPVKVTIFSLNDRKIVTIKDSEGNVALKMEFGPNTQQSLVIPPGEYVVEVTLPMPTPDVVTTQKPPETPTKSAPHPMNAPSVFYLNIPPGSQEVFLFVDDTALIKQFVKPPATPTS